MLLQLPVPLVSQDLIAIGDLTRGKVRKHMTPQGFLPWARCGGATWTEGLGGQYGTALGLTAETKLMLRLATS